MHKSDLMQSGVINGFVQCGVEKKKLAFCSEIPLFYSFER